MKNRVREVRLQNSMSQAKMAEFCKVSRQTIHAIESQKLKPTVYLALRISIFLGLTVEEIFILEG